MKALYDSQAHGLSRRLTRAYSTSFSLGILCLDRDLRQPVYDIYGFVRLADEIVDTFAGYDQAAMLADFRRDTFKAVEAGRRLVEAEQVVVFVVEALNFDNSWLSSVVRGRHIDKIAYVFDL